MKLLLTLITAIFIFISCTKTNVVNSVNLLAVPSSKDSVVFTDTLYSNGTALQDANLPQYINFDSVFLSARVSQHGNNHRIDDYEFNGLQFSYETFLPDYSNTQIFRIKIVKDFERYFTGEDSVYGVYVGYSALPAVDTALLSVVYYLPAKN